MCENRVRSFAVHAMARACQREHRDEASRSSSEASREASRSSSSEARRSEEERVEAAYLICKSIMPERVLAMEVKIYTCFTQQAMPWPSTRLSVCEGVGGVTCSTVSFGTNAALRIYTHTHMLNVYTHAAHTLPELVCVCVCVFLRVCVCESM